MPLREYKCKVCGGKIEMIVARSFDKIAKSRVVRLHNKREVDVEYNVATVTWECICNGGQVSGDCEEIIGAPAIRFKGPGFHVDDYGHGPRFTHRSRNAATGV